MSHSLQEYLTEYDRTLFSESYIDPVGTLIIWSAFGRQVFRNRINSVSNDVRNYTINLFHHFLVRKLINDDSVVLSTSLQRHYHNKDAMNFKQACLIFMENIFVYSILRHEETIEGLDFAGILGIFNARRRWAKAEGKPIIIFTHESAGHILVRQLSLGVSGRYKTPLMEIGFFDSNYYYHKPAYNSHWADAEDFIVGAPNSILGILGKLEHELYAFLKERVAKLSLGGKVAFSDDVNEKLTKSYARAFASSQMVGKYSRDFWLRQTGLNEGAAGALLDVIEKSDADLTPRDALHRALGRDLPSSERDKLERIDELEPFLSDCALLFTLMAAERKHTIEDVASLWSKFGRDETRLPLIAKIVEGHASQSAVQGTAAAKRLNQLRSVANSGSFGDQVRAMAEYHKEVMLSRGQASWLNVEDNGTIRVHARTLAHPLSQNWLPGAWNNAYYLPQFKDYINGLCGDDA